MSEKTTIQVATATSQKLKRIKAKTHLSLGVLADIGLRFVCEGINRGTLRVSNGRVVPTVTEEPQKAA